MAKVMSSRALGMLRPFALGWLSDPPNYCLTEQLAE
jgi:hypothetical protein